MRKMRLLMAFCGALAVFSPDTSVVAQDTKTAPQKEKTQEVVAEGVGATADEAIKDAYRNAVRQVVGAVVDAETFVKNDEVIDDKVLTYSDGFIKGYEEVAGSKKTKGGLHRIKIKAQVERRSVIAKLKAANVTVKDVDGKGLFAEAVTQLDAEKDAAALLKKQFEGFPQSCITATVIGKPEIVEKSADQAKVKLDVQFDVDQKAYKAFSDRLIPVLEKIAKDKGEFTATYAKRIQGLDALVAIDYGFKKWMPRMINNYDNWVNKDQVSICIATNRTKIAEKIEYKYYGLDPSVEPVLKAVALRQGKCKLQLLDTEGESVATDRFELVENLRNGSGRFYVAPTSAYGSKTYDSRMWGISRDSVTDGNSHHKVNLLSISPVFGDMKWVKPALTISRTLTLSLDELKSVKDAKVEITFDE